jgi:hypothetical protein
MKMSICGIVLLLLLCTTVAAQAGVYTWTLSGALSDQTPTSVDFGRAFTSIQSVSYDWSGYVHPGRAFVETGQGGYWQDLPGIWIGFLEEGNHSSTGISPGSLIGAFHTSGNITDLGPSPWSFLLDGRAAFQTTMGYPSGYGSAGPNLPWADQCSLTLTIYGVPVPEPSNLTTVIGLAGCSAFMWRKYRRQSI